MCLSSGLFSLTIADRKSLFRQVLIDSSTSLEVKAESQDFNQVGDTDKNRNNNMCGPMHVPDNSHFPKKIRQRNKQVLHNYFFLFAKIKRKALHTCWGFK